MSILRNSNRISQIIQPNLRLTLTFKRAPDYPSLEESVLKPLSSS